MRVILTPIFFADKAAEKRTEAEETHCEGEIERQHVFAESEIFFERNLEY